MKMCDIMEVFMATVEEVIFTNWKHEGFIGGWTSGSGNFEIDGQEYVLNLKEIADGEHWSEKVRPDDD